MTAPQHKETLTMKKFRTPIPKNSKWKAEYPVLIYKGAASGFTNEEIAKNIGVSKPALDGWLSRLPEARFAMDEGRKDLEEDEKKRKGEKTGTLADYVFEQLSPNLRGLWEQLEFWNEAAAGPEKIEALLGKESTRVRQSLWMHAMVVTGFNASAACRMVNVTKRQLDWWTNNDPEFPALVEELQFHKKNFFENAVINLAKSGSEKAAIAANAALNSDRGYGKKIGVEHSGTVQHNHNLVPLEKLDLPMDILLVIEERMSAYALANTKAPIPVQALPVGGDAATEGEDEDDDEEEDAA